jgi:CRISPR/Cas system CSM-associated protein Csm3 (group 7 of RAMP superfamily)
MAVTAPFQFARIPRAVWFPNWGNLVSHDVPFKDGYSGTIDIEIEAMTPLLIGGTRREATKEKEGEVWPVRLPDGTYAIPGSSLQGVIRNILEIACFGKLGPWVDDKSYSNDKKAMEKLTSRQMLYNSSDGHLDRKKYDLPSLMFGGVGDGSENAWLSHSLKRRASFESAKACGHVTPITPQYDRLTGGQFKKGFAPSTQPDATILLGPKPSYYPIYVRQPNPVNGLYASYTPAKRRAKDAADNEALARWVPELSGAKLWPSPVDFKAEEKWRLPAPAVNFGNQTRGQIDSKETHVSLNALPAGTTFSTKLHFHNLRKVELGALLWALTFGDKVALSGGASENRHRVGMGKPYGMGSIKIALKTGELVANNDRETTDTGKILDHFVYQMNNLLPTLANESKAQWIYDATNLVTPSPALAWDETVQIKGLKEAAKQDPAHETGYMPLNGDDGYTKQRNGKDALSSFVSDGWELTRRRAMKDVPIAEAQISGNLNNQTNRNVNNTQNYNQHQSHQQRANRAEVGCPVTHLNGQKGEIVKIEYGLHSILTVDGQTEDWPINSFTVTGPPEL